MNETRKDSRRNGRSGNVVINNVTNITNVTNVTQVRIDRPHWKKRRWHAERKPALYDFCATCGLKDGDKLMHMSRGEAAKGFVDVLGYQGRQFSRDMAECGREISRGLGGMCDGIEGTVKILCELFSNIFG